MKTNKKVWKIVSVILELAMVVTLMPSGLFSGTTTVKATTDYFGGSGVLDGTSSTYSAWTTGGASVFTWGNYSAYNGTGAYTDQDAYTYHWYYESATTAYFYKSVTLSAGEYTLQANIEGASTSVYPYVGGQVSSYSVSATGYGTKDTFSTTITIDEAGTYNVGFYFSISAGGWGDIWDMYLYGEDSDDSGSSSGGTTTTTYEVEWADGNVPGTFESGTLGTSAPTDNGFYASSTSYVQRSTSYYNSGSYSAQMRTSNSGGMGSTSISLYYGADTSTGSTPSTSKTLSTSFTEYTYTFTATATTEYLVFATAYSSNSGQPGGSSSSTYYYLYGQITDLTVGTEYTVSFYARYYSNGNGGGATYYAYIDDVVVTYDVVETADPIYVPYDETNYPDNSQDYVGEQRTDNSADDFYNWTTSGSGSIKYNSYAAGVLSSTGYYLEQSDYTNGGTVYAYYASQPYIFTESSTYVVTANVSGTEGIEIYAALFDSSGNLLTTLDDPITISSGLSSGWDVAEYLQTEVTIPSEYLNTEVYIGISITYSASTWFGISDFTWVYGELEEVEVVDLTEDRTYAVMNDDLSSNWKFSYGCYLVTNESYPFGTSSTYLKNYYWDKEGYTDSTSGEEKTYTEYDTAQAYYKGEKFVFSTAATYTWEGYMAGYNFVAYPALYNVSTGEVTYFEEAAYDLTDTTVEWSEVSETQAISFEIDDSIADGTTEYYVGIYVDTPEYAWFNMTNYSFYCGEAGETIWDDQPENGDFEYGNGYAWIGYSDMESDDSGDYLYGYGVDQSASGVDGYAFNIWNNDENEYEFTVTQYIRMNTAGTYYIDYETIGENVSRNMALYAMVDAYSEDYNVESAEFELEVPGSYTDWTEYIPGYDSSLEDPWETAEGFTVDEGDIIVLTLYFYLEQYDYFSIDNIKFVQEGDEVMQGRTYIAVDCFENGGFEDTWNISQYWSDSWTDSEGTEYESDYDSSENGDYGFKIDSASSVVNSDYITDVDTEDNAVYFAWNNDTTSSHTFYLTQQIEVTTAGNYEFSADTRRWIYNSEDETDEGYATMYVYSADGDVIETMDLTPQGDDAWTTIESGKVSISEAQTITVVVEIYMPASYLAGQWDSDDDGTEDTDYYADSKICLDNFVFEEYVQITIEGDGDYTPVIYNGSYVNGGNYVKGVDLSSIISLEAAGTTFTDDVFQMLKDEGVNSIRIRIWVDPYDDSGNLYGGGQNDGALAALIAQRAADVGMSVMLSFHLSDFWADPDEQLSPKDWSSYTYTAKAEAAANHVNEVLTDVYNTGVDIAFVTIGNEVTAWTGVSGITYTSYTQVATVLVTAAQAVTEFNDEKGTSILVGFHVAPTFYSSSATSGIYSTVTTMASYYSGFWNNFDFFSTSCYPYWVSHGNTTNDMTAIASQLKSFVTNYGKPVMITEYNWPYILNGDQDGSAYQSATENGDGTYTSYASDGSVTGYWNAWSVDRQGQADMIQELNEYFATYEYSDNSDTGYFIGTYYWEPAWIAAGNTTGWSSSQVQKWLNYGCGVATYYGAEYMGWSGYDDPSTSGYDYAFGSKTDEFTLFTSSGAAAASLSALNYSNDTMPILKALGQTNSDGSAVRFVGTLDIDESELSNYDYAGFKVEYCISNEKYSSIKERTTTTLYTAIKAGGTTYYPDFESGTPTTDSESINGYFYTYTFTNIPTDQTYYFKVIATVSGQASYQQSIKYFKLYNGTLEEIDPWEYQGTNLNLETDAFEADVSDGVNEVLYPSYVQNQ